MLLHDDARKFRKGDLYSGNNGTIRGLGKFIQYGGLGALVVSDSLGALRNGRLGWDGRHQAGAFPVYSRLSSHETFTPPYRVGGMIRVFSRLDSVLIENEQREPTWDWAVTFQPEFVSPATTYVHTIWGAGRTRTRPAWSAKRDNVYASKIPDWPEYDIYWRQDIEAWAPGRWVEWSIEVPDYGHHLLRLDGQLVQEIKVKKPLHRLPGHLGLRLDFFDVEIADTYHLPLGRASMRELGQAMKILADGRVLDTRQTSSRRLGPGATTTVQLPKSLAGVSAVGANVTIVDASSPGFVTAWCSGSRPDISVQNHPGGSHAVAGFTVVEVDGQGRFRLYNSSACHLIVDVVAAW